MPRLGSHTTRHTAGRAIRLLAALGATTAYALALAPSTVALDNGLARTPPMGWNSWNQVRCCG
ncbi:hypothetical protein AB0C51_19150 [Streptomyces pathocidini]|uniref:hypothetical protein n=1 Tax=Streptomyces pathocidini TaxID=1650571 RepID=UPI0034103098